MSHQLATNPLSKKHQKREILCVYVCVCVVCVCVCVCAHVYVCVCVVYVCVCVCCVCVCVCVRTDSTRLHNCLTNVMIVILVCNTEHIWDIPVPLPQLVVAANMSAWGVQGTKQGVEIHAGQPVHKYS